MKKTKKKKSVVRLPSDPSWFDGLPHIKTLAEGPSSLRYGIIVPGTGQVVAACATAALARGFVVYLGKHYVDRACELGLDIPAGGEHPPHLAARTDEGKWMCGAPIGGDRARRAKAQRRH